MPQNVKFNYQRALKFFSTEELNNLKEQIKTVHSVPVSYTHLDVYKRQVFNQLERHMATDESFALLNGCLLYTSLLCGAGIFRLP